MAQFPNISVFLKSELSLRDSTQTSVTTPAKTDEGFTSEASDAILDSCLPQWQPKCKYRQIDIDCLVPGPSCVSLQGRIVNLYQQQQHGQMPNDVAGCWRLTVKDGTAAVLVILLVYSFHPTS